MDREVPWGILVQEGIPSSSSMVVVVGIRTIMDTGIGTITAWDEGVVAAADGTIAAAGVVAIANIPEVAAAEAGDTTRRIVRIAVEAQQCGSRIVPMVLVVVETAVRLPN